MLLFKLIDIRDAVIIYQLTIGVLRLLQHMTEVHRDVRGFRSNLHAITTIRQEKKALSLWEDKRAWTSINESVAFGHYSLSSPPPSKRARIK